ncbi:MAG TPA: amidohydrolase family protein [Candidatus Binataceae bacterium]|nr:amidohydrolase family protein [Candidatus Binataceae bacterium]
MAYDIVIKGGTIVDGTGAPGFRADVAIAAGKIAEVGRVTDGARDTIDAGGLVVAPGFVDPHTHYDAQICWDPLLTSSSWHGVTSVVMGNCGVGIAPCKPAVREIAAWDLVNVEAIPFAVLSRGITWDWVSFPEFMDAAERRGVGINVGFLAPLTPFRHFVMGEESMERAATAEETAQIAALLREAVGAGAMGFSTTAVPQHIGYKGRPLACRNASREELKTYAGVLGELQTGAIEVALTKAPGILADDEYEFLDLLLRAGGRPVTWLALLGRDDDPDACMRSLDRAEPLVRRGAVPQVTCRPLIVQFNLREPFIFANLRSTNPVFNQPPEVQIELYRNRDFRAAFRADLARPGIFCARWDRLEIKAVGDPAMRTLEGRTVGEIARARGCDGMDTFLDIGIADGLRTEFTCPLFNADEARIPELLRDPRTMIGLSDGGAHVDMLIDAGYPTYLLGTWVRERQALTLERAVQRITSEPADFFGIRGRGRLKPGLAADVSIFDPNTVGSALRGTMRDDLPGGGRRLVMEAHGVYCTIVNGRVLYRDGRPSEARPGMVLRCGRC